MSTVDICGIVGKLNTGTSIAIPPGTFGPAGTQIATAIQQILSGSLQVGNPGFSYTCQNNVATIQGVIQSGPLDTFTLTLVFKPNGDNVEMDLKVAALGQWNLGQAYSALNTFPFNSVVVTGGSLELDAVPGAGTVTLTATVTANFDGQSLNTAAGQGLLIIEYGPSGGGGGELAAGASSLGFLAGFLVTGAWQPLAKWPALSALTFTEGGLFVSTITQKDLSAFDAIKPAFLPDEIDPGLTFVASLALEGNLSTLADFFPSGTTLNLTGIIPQSSPSNVELIADLEAPIQQNSFAFQKFELDWKLTSEVSITIIAGWEGLTLQGTLDFNYGGAEPSLNGSIYVGGLAKQPWAHPFGIPTLEINGFGVSFGISAEGVTLGVEGDFVIGTEGSPNAVTLELAGGILDFEVPAAILADLRAEDAGKTVTLPQLVQDFIPALDLSSVPLLNGISFQQLSLWIVDSPFTDPKTGKTYNPGIGATGNISFYSLNLDFAFTLSTNKTPVSVQGFGTLGKLVGGTLQPFQLQIGGFTLLQISGADGTGGASACIDTTASGYCNDRCGTCGSQGVSLSNAYFCLNGQVQLFNGVLKDSLCAVATKDAFEFFASFQFLGITEKFACVFNPAQGQFSASGSVGFSLPNLTLGPWGCIPAITIPLPSANACIAFGSQGGGTTVCDGFTPPATGAYFHIQVSFTWGEVDFNIQIDLDLATVQQAFQQGDFGQWLVSWLGSNAEQVFAQFIKGGVDVAKTLAKLLYQAGVALVEATACVVKWFGEEIGKIVAEIFDELGKLCGVSNGNAALQGGGSAFLGAGPLAPVLADLTESKKGQGLLYHYYLHQPELQRLLAPGSPVALRAQSLLTNYSARRTAGGSGGAIGELLTLLGHVSDAASPELRASLAEVQSVLQQHKHRSYPELLAALAD